MDVSNKFLNLEQRRSDFKTAGLSKNKSDSTGIRKVDLHRQICKLRNFALYSINETNWMFRSNNLLVDNFAKQAAMDRSNIKFL